jgi:ATP-binding cassette subfamily B protein
MNEENMDNKNMTVREMWHYLMFQTKGYWTIKAAIVLGALTTAAVPYVGNLFYAGILDQLVLTAYDTAVRLVLWMVSVTLVLKLAAKGCDRMVYHYCEPCAYEIKKRTAQKAFSMEYETLDRTETLAAFRRVRAGEQGMGGVERQLSEIYGFFQELAGIVFAGGFVLVLFTRTDSTRENIRDSVLMFVLMLLAFAAVLALSNYLAQKDGAFRVQTELENERVNTLSAYLLNLVSKEAYVKDTALWTQRLSVKKDGVDADSGRNLHTGRQLQREMSGGVSVCGAAVCSCHLYLHCGKSDRGKYHHRGSERNHRCPDGQ